MKDLGLHSQLENQYKNTFQFIALSAKETRKGEESYGERRKGSRKNCEREGRGGKRR